LKGRSSKQIRDRWVNNLNPERHSIKWGDEMDKLILEKYLELGSSWVAISKFIPNSTENMIKNRFYSMLRSTASKIEKCSKKEKQKNKKDTELKLGEKTLERTEDRRISEEFLLFDFEEEQSMQKEKEKQRNKKYKRIYFSLPELLQYLPVLLEQKEVDISKFETFKNKSNSLNKKQEIQDNFMFNEKEENYPSIPNQQPFFLDEEKKSILNKFFNHLSEKIPSQNEKSQAFKFKSSILLNLQLSILHKIFEKCKMQLIQRFFEYFKENTISVQSVIIS
jgi:hypothetical protein